MRKLNVLYVISSTNYSGAEIVITRLIINNLKKVQPFVVCPKGKLEEILSSNGIITIPCKYLHGLERQKINYSFLELGVKIIFNLIGVTLTIIQEIKNRKIDIVHSNNFTPSVYTLPSLFYKKCTFSKVKWIWSNHDLNYLMDKSHGNKISKLLSHNFDRTLSVSNAVKKSLDPTMSNKKNLVIYNGINLDQFSIDNIAREQFRETHLIGDDDIVIAIIGTINHSKGQDIVINAFQNASKNTQRILKLIIAGRVENENYLDELKKLITDSTSILILNHTDNILTLFNGIDILINATRAYRSEPLGTTIIEAMALKKISIASNTGGSVEIIDDKKNGYIFEADNVSSLTEVLISVINNYNNQENLRDLSLEKVREKFEITTMTNHYNKILTELN